MGTTGDTPDPCPSTSGITQPSVDLMPHSTICFFHRNLKFRQNEKEIHLWFLNHLKLCLLVVHGSGNKFSKKLEMRPFSENELTKLTLRGCD